MPTPYLKKLVKAGKGSISELEKKWKKAKSIAAKSGHKDDFDYITGIFNKMIGESDMTRAERILSATNESRDQFNYMMLGRLRDDNEYFLHMGAGSPRTLWAGNVKDQIKEMKKIYNSLKVKPKWITMADINKYEKDMLAMSKARGK